PARVVSSSERPCSPMIVSLRLFRAHPVIELTLPEQRMRAKEKTTPAFRDCFQEPTASFANRRWPRIQSTPYTRYPAIAPSTFGGLVCRRHQSLLQHSVWRDSQTCRS